MLTARVAHFREVHVKSKKPHVAQGARAKKRGAYPVVFTSGFDEEMWGQLQDTAVARGCSISELIRVYVQGGLDEEDHVDPVW